MIADEGNGTRAQVENWLSTRIGVTATAPDLEALGFKLVAARLMTLDGTVAQLLYRDATGRQMTLAIAAAPGAADKTFAQGEAGGLNAVWWVDGGTIYAAVGQLTKAEIDDLATAVLAQLG